MTKILRRIWPFSANKIKSPESFCKQPTQFIVELNSSLRHMIVTNLSFSVRENYTRVRLILNAIVTLPPIAPSLIPQWEIFPFFFPKKKSDEFSISSYGQGCRTLNIIKFWNYFWQKKILKFDILFSTFDVHDFAIYGHYFHFHFIFFFSYWKLLWNFEVLLFLY